MSGILSKRQLARNEIALQELVKLPGNNVCADCQARNPGWASWSLGIFLCMRCAAFTRKLGTHITKVKSLSMDSWSKDQVDHMKKVGNVASNRIYNPQNTRPPIPIDADEADSAMERFYPPKNIVGILHIPPLIKGEKKTTMMRAPNLMIITKHHSPPRRNKHSRILGLRSMQRMIWSRRWAKLRELGFMDEKRNTAVLKGLSGNLEKSIETLVRLGEGGSSAKTASSSMNSSAPRTPASPPGLSFERPQATSPAATSISTNPFDRLDNPSFPQVQSSHSTGSMAQTQNQMGGNPYQSAPSTNPFGLMPSQSQLNLNQAFQNMSVSSPQPLFPHHTGGVPGQQSQLQVDRNTNPFMPQAPPAVNTNLQSNPFMQQSVMNQALFSSPVAQTPQQQYPSGNYNLGGQNPPPQQMNPFFNQVNMQQPQQQPHQQPQTAATTATAATRTANRSMAINSSPKINTNLRRKYNSLNTNNLRRKLNSSNTNSLKLQLKLSSPNTNNHRRKVNNLSVPTTSGASSTASIRSISTTNPTDYTTAGWKNPIQQQAPPQAVEIPQPNGQISGGSNNPFMSNAAATPNGGTNTANGSGRQISRESMMIEAGGWQNGRHSPDAWGKLVGGGE
ncbi:hypothetical protein EYC84_001091 [Monilinia fructicola]|uniref:Arf-GAP domain-containing protein n=1 Tax=Monilinia fructicola TaxID=38448 RepID=A0A5M9JN96_MONFR|nr:hypothetical protein EYC84_001091 [Monilinia fructicola]